MSKLKKNSNCYFKDKLKLVYLLNTVTISSLFDRLSVSIRILYEYKYVY